MRDLIITQNITLDGVIDATDGWFDPASDDADQSDLNEALHEQAAAADAFLVGRVTFEDMRGYWPQQTNDTTGVTDYLNKVQKYVVSTTLRDPRWANTTILAGDLKEEITTLKSQPGKDIVTTGSIRLTHALIESDLVDEFRLFVYPVVLGHGARLFDRHKASLHLVETRPFTSGVALLRYRVA
ncbi:dihydrofolate reductase family protein [Streptomyces alboflavus]|uniref:dihydrofolate reductase family protein n=1 Tax=Streptomyces alboflavus TaxID=67267 RepID=UPI0004C28122|nr:dihydrofolate reductase family protein [Streptomyces alboflavus]